MEDRAPTEHDLRTAAPLLPVVLYDGACRFCVAQAERVRHLARGAVQVRPLQQLAEQLPWIDADEAARALTLVDEAGRPVRGAAAVVEVLVRARPALRGLRAVYALRPVRALADAAYAFVAARRYALFGRSPDHPACDDASGGEGPCDVPFRHRVEPEGGRGRRGGHEPRGGDG